MTGGRLRWLPAVHACLDAPPADVQDLALGPWLEKLALERALTGVREQLIADAAAWPSEADVNSAVAARWTVEAAALARSSLGAVINATGVVVHTNLGRAPLAPEAAPPAHAAAAYTPLEFDLESGKRGSRYDHAVAWLRLLSGADDALVVNNNAAALVLAIDTLAGGRSVVVSRGELVEIGGGFRVHEIITSTGVNRIEVGATNRTHIDDYARAFDDGDVGAVLKVHRSNFDQRGFVHEVELERLCRLAGERGIPVVYDQGTGLMGPLAAHGSEPTMRSAIEAGAAVVCGSGDKLLGGPQAGLLCGRREVIESMRRNPLLRALRVDKGTLAALEATLRLTGSRPQAIPVPRMLGSTPEELERAARAIVDAMSPGAREQCSVEPHAGRSGGGTLPEVTLPGFAVQVRPRSMSPAELGARLRGGSPPIVSRVTDDAVWLDVRTVLPGQGEAVARVLDVILDIQ